MPKRKKHKSAVIIKGNPYYLEQGPDVENYAKYYKEIEGELRKAGYGDVTYDRGDDYTTPRKADLWVGHSRGAGALWKAPEGTRTLDITKYEDGYEEYKALMAKELKKRGYKRTRDFPVHLRPVPGPEHYTLTQRAKDAIMMHKVGERKKLYHGSPHKLDEIRPAIATGKGESSAREHAIYLANNPEEARLYALTRPRNNKRKGWAILDNKVHYVKGDPINKQGYVYEHEFDDYAAPPESDPGIGYRVYGAYKPTKRKRVRLRGIEDQFVEHPDKASYKAKVKEWLATREKTAATNMYHGSNAKFDRFETKRHKLSGDQRVVFGTPLRAMAIAGMGRRWTDDDFEQGTYNDEDLLHMRELKPGALERIYKGTRGYLYEMDPKSFEHGGDAYMPTEFISKSSPKILKRTEVDAYQAMLDEEKAGRMKIHRMRKTSSAKHTLVTGHSGAGKSTLARSFGLPIHALDDDPDIREQLNRQMAYAKEHGGRLPIGAEYDKDMKRAERRAIDRALALKEPHVIDGAYLLNRNPEDFKMHNMHLVDTPEATVLDRRVERQRVKDLARNRHWDDERAAGVRMRGQQLIDEYAPGVKRWRKADYVKKAALQSQEEIWQMLKRRVPRGAHHVSGGLPDARGTSDVDIYLPRKRFKGLENRFPEGTSVVEQGDDYSIYGIPGFGREVNVYATSNKAKQESVDHRRTMMELAKKYPQLERKAFAIKAKGKGSEPAWAEVLGLKGDPYEVMANTDEVMRHAAQIKQANKATSSTVKRRRGSTCRDTLRAASAAKRAITVRGTRNRKRNGV